MRDHVLLIATMALALARGAAGGGSAASRPADGRPFLLTGVRLVTMERAAALEDGAVIRVLVGNWPAIGVDTREDLVRAEQFLAGSRNGC